jgi:hypothetical protein
MIKRLVVALAVICLGLPALAQTPGTFQGVTANPNAPPLSAAALNAAFGSKADATGGVLTNPTISGVPGVSAVFAGQSQNNALLMNLTAASATTPEGGLFIHITSAIGAASGNGPVSAYKIGEAIQTDCNPGSGNCYGLNIVNNIPAGFGAFSAAGLEINTNNVNHDYPFGGYGGVVDYPFQILANATFPVTAAMAIGNLTTNYAYHAGIYFSTGYGAQDYSIYDIDNAQYSYNDAGTHSAAGIWEHSTAPIGVFVNGTYSSAAIQDGSTAPFGIVLGGTYGTSSVYDVGTASYGLNDNGTHSAAGIWEHSTAPIGVFINGTHSSAGIQDSTTAPYGLALVGTYGTAALTTPGLIVAGSYKAGTSAGVTCLAGTVNLSTLVITAGLVTHC